VSSKRRNALGEEIPLRIPRWALETLSAPAPGPSETFTAYCDRIGAPTDELLGDLNEQTADLANVRLATWIQRQHPEKFRRYTRSWLKTLVPSERLVALEIIGENIRIGRWS